jgi:hypothetical protein
MLLMLLYIFINKLERKERILYDDEKQSNVRKFNRKY